MKSMMWRSSIALVLGMAFGCTPQAQEPPPHEPSPQAHMTSAKITDRDWELAELGDFVNPRGARNRPVTLRLDAATSRAAGFAGCNQYSASYVLTSDSLRLQAPISTKMACTEGMELETRFLRSLPETRTFLASDSTLTLVGSSGPLALFRAHAATPER